MKYSDLRESLQPTASVTSLDEYYVSYFSKPLQDAITAIDGKYVYHLYSDLSGIEIGKDLEAFLGGSYRNADAYAKDCVQVALNAEHLYGMRIKGWTDSALKCFDGFLLVLIQDILKEKIVSRRDVGLERHKYHHLIDKGGEYAVIGVGFDTVYQQRNELTHVEIVEDNGNRRQRPMSRKRMNRYKAIIMESFQRALSELEKKI
jgi:hypothetical protein